MNRTHRRSKTARNVVFVAAAALSALIVGTQLPTLATPPGANGRIAFASNRDGNRFAIYTMNPNGTGLTRITNSHNADDTDPDWTTSAHPPSGLPADPPEPIGAAPENKIAFVSNRDGVEEIYTMNPDGTQQVRMTQNTAVDAQPAWSPDGTQIAFASDRTNNMDIFVMPYGAGSEATRLTFDNNQDVNPAWSPDGTKIAWASNKFGNYDIWVMNPDGTEPTQITFDSSSEDQPSWSPDGTKIAFVSDRDGQPVIYTMDPDGKNQARLTPPEAPAERPMFSPDGTRLVFANADGDADVHVSKRDGTEAQRLTEDDYADIQPAWEVLAADASPAPSDSPSASPSGSPSPSPSGSPSPSPSGSPTPSPSGSPSASPSGSPSASPSGSPSASESPAPSEEEGTLPPLPAP